MVLKNSTSDYLFKADDDCYVNVDVFENLMSNLNSDYVGKIIMTNLGPDRYWHVEKSNSVYAKNTPDLALDISKYCDGIGYFLSRKACYEIIKNSKSQYGQILVSTSFYEDKLIGDLAKLSITPEEPLNYCNREKIKKVM